MIHEVKLLGPWEFRGGAEVEIPVGQLRLLLTSLVLSANQTVTVDTLADQLWPHQLPVRARGGVHTYVGRLRKLVGPGVIDTQRGAGYRLTIPDEVVDVHRFRHLLDKARAVSSPDTELNLLRAALTLWRGAPFADLYSTWLDRDVAPRLTEEWFAAVERRLELELATGEPEALVPELRGLADRYPTHEAFWQYLITALHRAGRQADALAAYRQVRAALRDELGIDPGIALVALHEEILRDGAAPVRVKPATVTPRQLPHDIARFTGRAAELAILDELLPGTPAGAAPTIVLIDGAPGVGKTTLAVHWAHRAADRYPDAQLYVNLRGYGPGEPLPAAVAAEKLLRALGVPAEQIPSEVDDRATLLRSTLSGRKVLLLLDNARNAEQVRPLLPGTTCLVVVTSRGQLRGLSISDGAHRVTLHPLPRRQSVELLDAAVGQGWVAEQPEAAAELVELCDRLPLAIAIVAERAHRVGSLAQVVAELANEQARLDVLDVLDPGEDNPHSSLRAALYWSYRTLGPDAAAMFRLLGTHPASDLEVRAAAALADLPVARTRVLLDQLVAAHLVEQRHPNRYELHDLIRLYANEMAEQLAAGERAAAAGRVLDWYLHAAIAADDTLIPHRRRDFLAPYEPAVPPPTFASARHAMTWFEEEYECLRSVCAWAAGHGFAGHAWRIAVAMTAFFHHTIPWREGLEFYHFAVEAALGANEPVGEGYTLNSLGCMYFDMEAHATAMTHVLRSLVLFRDASHRLGEAMARNNIALIQAALGNGSDARTYAAQALALYEELGYARGIAQTSDSIGRVHLVSGEYQQAVDCYRQALLIVDQLGDAESGASIRHSMAQAFRKLGDYPNATREFRRTVGLYRALGNRRLTATALADFGALLIEAGHLTIARSLYQTALPILAEYSDPRATEIEAKLAATGMGG